MKRLAGLILLAAGLSTLAQTVPSESQPQEKPKAESAPAATAKPQEQTPPPSAATPAGQQAVAEAQAPAPAPPAEVKGPEEKGLAFMKKIANRDFIGTLKFVSPAHQRVFSPGKLQYAWEKVEKRLGKIENMTVTHTDLEGDSIVMHVLLTCQKGAGEARLTYSAKANDDLLTGVQFAVLDITPAS